MQRIMELYEYLIEVQDPKFFAISLTIAFSRETETFPGLSLRCLLLSFRTSQQAGSWPLFIKGSESIPFDATAPRVFPSH